MVPSSADVVAFSEGVRLRPSAERCDGAMLGASVGAVMEKVE
jgi:hypothetical protein